MKCSKPVLAVLCLASIRLIADAATKDGGHVTYPAASDAIGPVVFSHRIHGSRGAGYKCRDCHASDSGEALRVTMNGIHQSETCGACHDGRTAGPRRKRAAHAISECAACHMPHRDIVIRLNRMDAVPFSHANHMGVQAEKKSSKPAGFSCSDCHPKPFEIGVKGPPRMEVPHDRGGCAICHNGKKRKDGMPAAFAATTRCITCHRPSEAPAP